ncbi:MAG TPA: glycosyltransferase family 4 protein [Burkholderiales bacterium]|nr:glycosyltransferase family 4 protein [Burkholderiales bacterium]
MNILFVCDNFPPEMGAGAARCFEHTRRWVAAGHRVTVVCAVPNFPEGKLFEGWSNRFQSETMAGIEVKRVWTYMAPNAGFVRRTLDQASFALAAVARAIFLPRPDVVVATSPHLLQAVAGYLISRVKRRPFVFELRDLWPDSIVAVGAMRESLVIRMLRKLEYFLYRRAAMIVSLTHSFKRVLTSNGIPASRVAVVPNGADLELYKPGARPETLASRLGVEGKFVAAYIGTVGMAHGLSSILEAAERLLDRDDIRFVVVGTGAEKDDLVREAARRGLTNVIFTGSVPKQEVPEYLKLADVALVLLRNLPLFEQVIPSKMFEAMAVGRAIILGVRGESREILERAGAGRAIPPADTDALVQAIRELAAQREQREAMAQAGRRFVCTEYDRDVLARRMLDVLENLNPVQT